MHTIGIHVFTFIIKAINIWPINFTQIQKISCGFFFKISLMLQILCINNVIIFSMVLPKELVGWLVGLSFTLYKFNKVHLLKENFWNLYLFKVIHIAAQIGKKKEKYLLIFYDYRFYYLFTLNVKCLFLSRVFLWSNRTFPFNIVLSHVSSTKNKLTEKSRWLYFGPNPPINYIYPFFCLC